MRALALLSALAMFGPAPALAQGTDFALRDLEARGPIRGARLWAPDTHFDASLRLIVLLHGNEGPRAPIGWMADELRQHPPFADAVLLAPSLDDDYRWDRRSALRALRALIEETLATTPADPARIVILGYSAGGSRVLDVARALVRRSDPLESSIRPALLVSLAGDVGRNVRQGSSTVGLRRVPLLLLCNSEDEGPNASCRLDSQNEAFLRHSRHMIHIRRAMRTGDHRLDPPWLATQLVSALAEHGI